MMHKHIGGQYMTPAMRARAHAEISLFAIAFAERRRVKGACIGEAVMANVEAKSDTDRQINCNAGIYNAVNCVQPRRIFAFVVRSSGRGIGRNSAVVCKRRDRADVSAL